MRRGLRGWGYQHKGICLVFKKESVFDKAECVKYIPHESLITVNIIEEYEPKDFILRKSEFWKYEKEWRLLHTYKKGQTKDRLFRFDPSLLCGIIFGCKISDEDKDLMTTLVKDRDVMLYQSEMSRDKYKLTLHQLK